MQLLFAMSIWKKNIYHGVSNSLALIMFNPCSPISNAFNMDPMDIHVCSIPIQK